MFTPRKFGKRLSASAAAKRQAEMQAVAIVREWVGPKADAATVNRLAAQIARRV